MTSLLYNKADAAKLLGISQSKLDRLVRDGEIDARRIGTKVLFQRQELVRFASGTR